MSTQLNDRFMTDSGDYHCFTCGAQVFPEHQEQHNEWHDNLALQFAPNFQLCQCVADWTDGTSTCQNCGKERKTAQV